jgi:GTPase
VPWNWGRGSGTPPASEPPSEPPLAFDSGVPLDRGGGLGVVVRVKDLYVIKGLGLVAVGVIEAGTLRPPVDLRVVPGDDRVGAPSAVRVKSAMAHHTPVEVATVGMSVGLELRGAGGEALPVPKGFRAVAPVRVGDRLISP